MPAVLITPTIDLIVLLSCLKVLTNPKHRHFVHPQKDKFDRNSFYRNSILVNSGEFLFARKISPWAIKEAL